MLDELQAIRKLANKLNEKLEVKFQQTQSQRWFEALSKSLQLVKAINDAYTKPSVKYSHTLDTERNAATGGS